MLSYSMIHLSLEKQHIRADVCNFPYQIYKLKGGKKALSVKLH